MSLQRRGGRGRNGMTTAPEMAHTIERMKSFIAAAGAGRSDERSGWEGAKRQAGQRLLGGVTCRHPAEIHS
jgi:hypothetical protein